MTQQFRQSTLIAFGVVVDLVWSINKYLVVCFMLMDVEYTHTYEVAPLEEAVVCLIHTYNTLIYKRQGEKARLAIMGFLRWFLLSVLLIVSGVFIVNFTVDFARNRRGACAR